MEHKCPLLNGDAIEQICFERQKLRSKNIAIYSIYKQTLIHSHTVLKDLCEVLFCLWTGSQLGHTVLR